MNVLQVSAQVSTLCKGLLAIGALEGSLSCVLSEMVPQVAAFLEDASTVWVFAFEIELYSLGLGVLYADSLVPLLGNSFESLMFASS